jgi:hypothetical protein
MWIVRLSEPIETFMPLRNMWFWPAGGWKMRGESGWGLNRRILCFEAALVRSFFREEQTATRRTPNKPFHRIAALLRFLLNPNGHGLGGKR